MRELNAANPTGFHRIQPVQVAFQKIAALVCENQGRIVVAQVVSFAGDSHAGVFKAGQIALDGLQALPRAGIAKFFQPARILVPPDHGNIADRRNDGPAHTGRTHGCQHAAIDVACAPRPPRMGVHVDDHWRVLDRSAGSRHRQS